MPFEARSSSALRSRAIAAVVLQAFIATASASAKVVYENGPPPYLERVLHALVGLAPVGLILLALCAAVMLYLHRPAYAVGALAACSLVIVVASSLLVAMDTVDNEFYQPWFFGSFFLAVIPGLAIWLAARRRSWWMVLAALLAPVPTWLAMMFAALLLVKIIDRLW